MCRRFGSGMERIMDLRGQLWATSDINMVNQACSQGVKVIYLGDVLNLSNEDATRFVFSSSFVPDYQTMSMQVDGNKEAFIQMYVASLNSKASVEMFSAILACLYKGVSVMFYLPPEASDLNFVQYLLQFIELNYGITTATKTTKYAFDQSYSGKVIELLYLNNLVTAQEFLINSETIDDISLRKLVTELHPMVEDPNNLEDIIEWFSKYRGELLTGDVGSDCILNIKNEKLKRQKKKETSNIDSQKALIDCSFFPENLTIDVSRVFPVMVMATMSSGKSTLINALLEKDILPSQNAACTAKIYSILDDDSEGEPKVYVTYKDGETKLIETDLKDNLDEANQDAEVSQIFISGEIREIVNTDKALLLIDTPGPNNSGDLLHEELTKNTLDKLRGGVILYLINATQMGINDDLVTLQMIKIHLEKYKDIKVLFVINKVDELDLEEEPVEKLVMDVKDYIESVGIKNPDIIPISALAANLFKKVLAGDKLTRLQQREFIGLYDLFQSTDFNMKTYVVTEGKFEDPIVKVGICEYKRSQLVAAIENTGLPYLENYLQVAQILSSKNTDIEIRIKQKE